MRVPGLRRGECVQTSMSVVQYMSMCDPWLQQKSVRSRYFVVVQQFYSFTIQDDTDFVGQRQIPAFLGIK